MYFKDSPYGYIYFLLFLGLFPPSVGALLESPHLSIECKNALSAHLSPCVTSADVVSETSADQSTVSVAIGTPSLPEGHGDSELAGQSGASVAVGVPDLPGDDGEISSVSQQNVVSDQSNGDVDQLNHVGDCEHCHNKRFRNPCRPCMEWERVHIFYYIDLPYDDQFYYIRFMIDVRCIIFHFRCLLIQCTWRVEYHTRICSY